MHAGSHSHGLPHGHAHGHNHAPASFGRAFAVGVGLNLTFVVVEVVYGTLAGSLALIADAGHNLSDVLGLLLAWGASSLAARVPTVRRTYGMRRSSILAALLNALLLLVAVGGIAWEAVRRFGAPAPVAETTVMAVAAIGMLVNGFTAWMFMSGRKADLNIRGAYLHMVADAAVSAGVVVAALVMRFTGWLWLDPAVSVAIVVVIMAGTWGLLRESLDLALDAVPAGIEPEKVTAYLGALPGVEDVHDLHIWGMSTTEAALTVHLVRRNPALDDALLGRITRELHDQFGIEHVTVQFEVGDADNPCRQAPATVV
ncbi:MAG: cation diffusion facilitator family transporter [Gemmatimonadota bacterium]